MVPDAPIREAKRNKGLPRRHIHRMPGGSYSRPEEGVSKIQGGKTREDRKNI